MLGGDQRSSSLVLIPGPVMDLAQEFYNLDYKSPTLPEKLSGLKREITEFLIISDCRQFDISVGIDGRKCADLTVFYVSAGV